MKKDSSVADELLTIDSQGFPCPPKLTQLLDKDIASLRKKHLNNDEAYIKEAGVIYYVGDPKSPPRAQGKSEAECLKDAIEAFDLPADYKPDIIVRRLIKKNYKDRIGIVGLTLENLLHGMNLANKVVQMMNTKMSAFLDDPELSDEQMLVAVNNIKIIQEQAKSIPSTMKAIETAYENYKAEQKIREIRGKEDFVPSMDAISTMREIAKDKNG